MSLKILYVGSFATRKLVRKYPTLGLDTYRVSEFLINGFRSQGDVDISVITSPELPMWPRNPHLYESSAYDESFDTLQLSSLNIPIIIQLWKIITIVVAGRKFINQNGAVKTNIIIPYMVFHHVFALWLLKKLYPKRVNTVIIIPDIFHPEKRVAKILNYFAEILAREFDAFILYTQSMASYLGVENKPQIVMEGVIDIDTFPNYEKRDNKNTVILYTGALHHGHDVMKLFEVMNLLNCSDIELWITGKGELYETVKKESEKDERITFWGTVNKDKVFELQVQADILINPRSDVGHEEITKYMFPSKVLEYMFSGNPAVVCRMSGIPEEYYQYLVVPDDNSAKSIAKSLEKVLEWSKEEKLSFGMRAKKFVSQKDAITQSGRIIRLIETL